MIPCACDWPTVTEPPSTYQAPLEWHRAVHDLGRIIADGLGIYRLAEWMGR